MTSPVWATRPRADYFMIVGHLSCAGQWLDPCTGLVSSTQDCNGTPFLDYEHLNNSTNNRDRCVMAIKTGQLGHAGESSATTGRLGWKGVLSPGVHPLNELLIYVFAGPSASRSLTVSSGARPRNSTNGAEVEMMYVWPKLLGEQTHNIRSRHALLCNCHRGLANANAGRTFHA